MHPPILNSGLGGQGSIRAAGWARKPRLHRQLRVSSPNFRSKGYRCAGDLSVNGSNGSAWSFPFFFNRISTLPSACSSSFRQAEDSCMPSSKRVRDFSRGTSPFSSSCTIFSKRWRHSSNLGNGSTPCSSIDAPILVLCPALFEEKENTDGTHSPGL